MVAQAPGKGFARDIQNSGVQGYAPRADVRKAGGPALPRYTLNTQQVAEEDKCYFIPCFPVVRSCLVPSFDCLCQSLGMAFRKKYGFWRLDRELHANPRRSEEQSYFRRQSLHAERTRPRIWEACGIHPSQHRRPNHGRLRLLKPLTSPSFALRPVSGTAKSIQRFIPSCQSQRYRSRKRRSWRHNPRHHFYRFPPRQEYRIPLCSMGVPAAIIYPGSARRYHRIDEVVPYFLSNHAYPKMGRFESSPQTGPPAQTGEFLRTGTIRPGNGVYGAVGGDRIVEMSIKNPGVPLTWLPNTV